MKHTIKQVERKDIINTSWHNLIVRASKEQIMKALGIKPIYYHSGETHYDWYLMLDNRFPFTIYDMTYEGILKKTDVIEYHIGWIPKYEYDGVFSNDELDDKGFPKQLDACYMIEALEERGLEVDHSFSWKMFHQ